MYCDNQKQPLWIPGKSSQAWIIALLDKRFHTKQICNPLETTEGLSLTIV
jgi:hypothetical protein